MSEPPVIVREPGRECNRVVAAVFAIVLGCLGIHKFYMGYVKEGIITIVAGTVGAFLIVPFFAVAILGVIEGIIYLTMTEDGWRRKYLADYNAWL